MTEPKYRMVLYRRTERGDPVVTPCKLTQEQYEEIIERYVVPNQGRPAERFAEVVEKRVQAMEREKGRKRR